MKLITRWLLMSALAVGLTGAITPGEAHARGRGKTKVELNGKLNLNEATASQLDLLPGVGEKAAEKIIAHRKKTPFKRIEELVKVKGFGKKKFEKLKPYLSVSGETNLTARRVKISVPEQPPSPGATSPTARGRRGWR